MWEEPTIEQLVAERDEWIEKYGIDWDGTKNKGLITVFDEMTEADHVRMKELAEEGLVWTNHSTSENGYYTAGYHVFEGDSGTWQTFSFYIAEVPEHDDTKRVYSTYYMSCPVCNADGEGEGAPDCEGPELPESKYGVDSSECEDGHLNIWLDQLKVEIC